MNDLGTGGKSCEGEASCADAVSDCTSWRQGDVLEAFTSISMLGSVATEDTKFGVIVISQTCDIVLSSRPNILLAKLVQLTDVEASRAKKGATPRYVHVPTYGQNLFVDLEYVATIDKAAAVAYSRIPGIDPGDDESVRSFALRIARRFGRFAFPNEVVPWFSSLQNLVSEKHRRPNSALGKAFRKVSELRVEAASWQDVGRELTLHVIVREGVIPELDLDENKDFPEISESLNGILRPYGELVKNVTEISEMLFDESGSLSTVDKYYLWSAFGEAVGNYCVPKGDIASWDPAVANAVKSISGLISTDREFSLAEYRRSEMLDLDHLSAPTPFSLKEDE